MSEISYQIHGSDLQFVEVTLPPNTAIVGEQGAMMYMDDHLQVDTCLAMVRAPVLAALVVFLKPLNVLLRVSHYLVAVIVIPFKKVSVSHLLHRPWAKLLLSI